MDAFEDGYEEWAEKYTFPKTIEAGNYEELVEHVEWESGTDSGPTWRGPHAALLSAYLTETHKDAFMVFYKEQLALGEQVHRDSLAQENASASD